MSLFIVLRGKLERTGFSFFCRLKYIIDNRLTLGNNVICLRLESKVTRFRIQPHRQQSIISNDIIPVIR